LATSSGRHQPVRAQSWASKPGRSRDLRGQGVSSLWAPSLPDR
jgi:hypothetical protein